ncbi:type IV toxin-antitoxin system AbiEi family antitoxin domain-containing protein [Mycobacterium sp. 1245111.1]|uniref:type IV toxin-antitoxin system AbiEi family antitoxin domain-containing protein n=1 Tax=Mycobacterium sp. 1245111.1 TaxID=1834073 RepID=UPI000A9446E4|nr:type IV toxin-antitoxin system AbiEi family antitoxin domain-containing protein [Mycobacterium sp. 1245111.1]
MTRSERYLPLADIASTQWGMITTAQARQVGITSQQIARLAANGVLERFHHGVYILNGVPRDRLTDLKAAWLALDVDTTAADRLASDDPGAVVSHRSAARAHDLGDIDADINEFTTTGPKRSRHKDIRLHRRTLDREDWTIIDGLPTTTVATTLADLAAAHIDGGHLGAALRDALVHGQIRTASAVTALRPYATDYDAPLGDGQTLIRSLLVQAGGLSRTLTAARSREFAWLAEQLDTAPDSLADHHG